MKTKKTSDRGFYGGKFTDSYGCECHLTESSAVAPHLWLGMAKNSDGEKVGTYDPTSGQVIGNYMHLSQKQIAELIPLLQHFVKHGTLPHDDK